MTGVQTCALPIFFGPDVDATGQVIRVRNQPFKVIGVMAAKGQSGMGPDMDDQILVPYTTVMKKLLGVTSIRDITVSAASAGDTSEVADQIALVLRTRHKIVPGQDDDFTVRTAEEIADIRTQAMGTMTTLLAGIAGAAGLGSGLSVIIASVVNIFLQSDAVSWVVSAIGVIVFTGLTAYDTAKIKAMAAGITTPRRAAARCWFSNCPPHVIE